MKKLKNILKNKKGASIMEFFIITVVALVVGAIIFMVGKNMKTGVNSINTQSKNISGTLSKDNMSGFESLTGSPQQ